MAAAKADGAFRTIGEVSAEIGVPQHVLRYWEGRFPQLRPLTRAGNRRYYRADDVALARRIHRLLTQEGYTVRGVQQLLVRDAGTPIEDAPPSPAQGPIASLDPAVRDELRAIRTLLADALNADA